MAKKVGRKSRKIEHKQRKCPRCDTEAPSVKLVLGDKPTKANWCPKCEEVFTQLGVRASVPKSCFKGMHLPPLGAVK